MKKLFYVTTFLMCTALFAQNNTIPNGVYVPDELTNERVELHFNEGKFYVTMIGGIMEAKNDSLYFKSDDDSSSFKLQVTQSDAKAKKLNLVFKKNGFRYGLNKYYLGLQKTANAEIKYVRLDEILDEEEGYLKAYASSEDPSAEVEKAAFMYLVHEDYRKNAVMEKFTLPADASEIEIDYLEDVFKNLKLQGRYDAEKQAIIIKERSKEIRFINKSSLPKIVYLTPDSVSNPKTFTYPGKVEEEDENVWDMEADSIEVVVDSAANAVDYDYRNPQYSFKHTKVDTYENGLKKLKENQFLVVIFDESTRAQRNFDNFIKEDENSMSYRMYDGYDPDYDFFNYYLATSKDKSFLKKWVVDDETTTLIFSKQGDMLFSIEGNLFKNQSLFNQNDTFLQRLNNAQSKAQIDAIAASKKPDLTQLKKELYASQMSKSMRPGQLNYTADFYPVIVDSTSASVDYDEEYEDEDNEESTRFKKGVFYKMKTPQDVLSAHWAKIREEALIKPLDSVSLSLFKTELERGIVESLYDKPKTIAASDYKILDVIEKNYGSLASLEDQSGMGYAFKKQLTKNVVQRFFVKNYTDEMRKGGEAATRMSSYYQKMLHYTNYDFVSVEALLDELKGKNNEQYYQIFEAFFNKITQGNVYENMNTMYTSGQEYDDWTIFKENIADLCNNTAWTVVENNLDKQMVAKAVNWAELALKLNPNSNYTLDTCAHLYYRNGDVQKAILTEQKAVELSQKYQDTENAEEYAAVLEKMKNGTYGK